jgi:hypothetical protein
LLPNFSISFDLCSRWLLNVVSIQQEETLLLVAALSMLHSLERRKKKMAELQMTLLWHKKLLLLSKLHKLLLLLSKLHKWLQRC